MSPRVAYLLFALAFFAGTVAATPPLDHIKLPAGFKIDVYAEVENARSLTLGDNGTVFVGTRTDKVYALLDSNRDGKADKVVTVAQGLNAPNGVAFRDGALYVAEINRILRFDNIEANLAKPPKPAILWQSGWKWKGKPP